MIRNTVRLRLTLWNVAVLAILLAGFAVTSRFIVKAKMADSVDIDLAGDGQRVAARWSRMSQDEFKSRLKGSKPLSGPPLKSGPSSLTANPGAQPDGLKTVGMVSPGSSSTAASTPTPAGDFKSRILDTAGRPLIPSSDPPWDDSWRKAAFGDDVFSTIVLDGEQVRVFSTPIVRGGKVVAVVQSAHSFSEITRLLNELTGTLLLLIPLGLALAGVGGAFLTDRAIRPVRAIKQAAAQIGAEDLSRRLPVSGSDEFAELASTFNGMVARLEDAFSRLEIAYEQQRQFTENASHELRTPLTAIKANTSLALTGQRSAGEYRSALEAVNASANTMTRIVQDLLLLARSDSNQLSLEMQPVSLQEMLQRVVDTVPRVDSPPISVTVEPPNLVVNGDRHHLGRLFVNLIENASRHTAPDGQIVITAHPEGSFVSIEVKDTGEGIPPEHLARVFDRFYRVDTARSRARGGTGLGLSICQSIVKAHGGTITLRSQPGVGTTAIVRLPVFEG